MAYWEWGDPQNDRVLLCVHGLTRTGRDFDRLARRLAGRYRVVCPDVVGRGRSDWLGEPAYYTVPQYVADMVTLIGRLDARVLHWFGTSMGGLIGMGLGGLPGASVAADGDAGKLSPPISRMILNDVGPQIAPEAAARIGSYVGLTSSFASFDEGVAYIRQVAETFGEHSDDEWRELARHVIVQRDGQWVRHYDPGLAMALLNTTPQAMAAGTALTWQFYAALQCPVLVVRGAESDLLTPDTLERMRAGNPRTQTVEIAGVGHAPTFMSDDQIDIAERFLSAC
ncbi:alpha/beta hydrolase [Verticiella sediminum]|uniref:Alpha/beta hydrolase n=2 Tax=Verticiella sediminum TaxID=1247510 RepID=A0A556AZQ4_9BURK|nr:alpha/beta hydrolase [Verticiella sediminum]TSH98404.1 alpha/beta hydrolase [Verticiella sediminum]